MLKFGDLIFKKARMSAILIKSSASQKCYTAELEACTQCEKPSWSCGKAQLWRHLVSSTQVSGIKPRKRGALPLEAQKMTGKAIFITKDSSVCILYHEQLCKNKTTQSRLFYSETFESEMTTLRSRSFLIRGLAVLTLLGGVNTGGMVHEAPPTWPRTWAAPHPWE